MRFSALALIGLILMVFAIGAASAYDQSGSVGTYYDEVHQHSYTGTQTATTQDIHMFFNNATELNSLLSFSTTFDTTNGISQDGTFEMSFSGTKFCEGTYNLGGDALSLSVTNKTANIYTYSGSGCDVAFSPALPYCAIRGSVAIQKPGMGRPDYPIWGTQTTTFRYNQEVDWYFTLANNQYNLTITRPGGIPSTIEVETDDGTYHDSNYGTTTPYTMWIPMRENFTAYVTPYNSQDTWGLAFDFIENTPWYVTPDPDDEYPVFEFDADTRVTPSVSVLIGNATLDDLGAYLVYPMPYLDDTVARLMEHMNDSGNTTEEQYEVLARLYPDGNVMQEWIGAPYTGHDWFLYPQEDAGSIWIHTHPADQTVNQSLSPDDYYGDGEPGSYGFAQMSTSGLFEADETGVSLFTRDGYREHRYVWS